MRALILLALPLALAACDTNDTAETRAETERNVTTQVVATNDTTAIDAATGQAANMAADVDFMPEDLNAAGNEAAPARSGPARSAPASDRITPRRPEPEPAVVDADAGEE